MMTISKQNGVGGSLIVLTVTSRFITTLHLIVNWIMQITQFKDEFSRKIICVGFWVLYNDECTCKTLLVTMVLFKLSPFDLVSALTEEYCRSSLSF